MNYLKFSPIWILLILFLQSDFWKLSQESHAVVGFQVKKKQKIYFCHATLICVYSKFLTFFWCIFYMFSANSLLYVYFNKMPIEEILNQFAASRKRSNTGVSNSNQCEGHILTNKGALGQHMNEICLPGRQKMVKSALIAQKTAILTIIWELLMMTRAACVRPLV